MTETPVTLSILVVSYNTRQMTIACLDSIVAETRETPCEIIVVDNASSDGSAEAIAAHPARPRLIALAENIGFARANNVAAQAARGELLLLLNPDTLVTRSAIDRLVEFSRNRPEAKLWGGTTIFGDGSLNRANAWRRMTLWNLACRATGLTALGPRTDLFNGEAYGGWERDTERAVDIVSGCFLLVSREFWRELGGFDPAFYMYGEEADLCLRAQQHGARPRITPDAVIVHHGGASEHARTAKMIRLLSAKAMLVRRHMPRPSKSIALALMAAWPLTRWLALAAVNRLSPSAARTEAAATWRAIWQARRDWLAGYREATAAADRPGTVLPATAG